MNGLFSCVVILLLPSQSVEGRGELRRNLWRVLQCFQEDFAVPAGERDHLMLTDGGPGSLQQRGDEKVGKCDSLEIGRALEHRLQICSNPRFKAFFFSLTPALGWDRVVTGHGLL